MNKRKLREIQKFLTEWRLLEGDMSVQRLSVLLETALAGEIEQQTLIRQGRFKRAATSKNIASWTALTATKQRGPDYVTSTPDPMNLKTRTIRLTPKGQRAIELALEKARLEDAQ